MINIPLSTDDKMFKLNLQADLLTTNDEFYGNHLELPNGWVVSIVKSPYSYGGKQGLFELALITPDGALLHNTVLGWLTPPFVADYALQARIGLLPEQQTYLTQSFDILG